MELEFIGNDPNGGSGGDGFSEVETIKNHIITSVTSPSLNTWTDFEGFTNVSDESNGSALSLNADGKTIDVLKEGLYQFGGCVHFQNNTGGFFASLEVLSRIFKNGTTEARCSQRDKTIPTFGSGAQDVLSYNGTDYLVSGDKLNLQYYTSNTALEFFSNANFQNQVAATIWLIYLGEF